MSGIWLALVAAFGACGGSYLGVVVDRLPVGRGLAAGSACGSCSGRLRAADNVPVVAYLRLRGQCRSCGGRIPVRWWLLEVAMAAAWVACAAVLGPGGLLVVALAVVWVAALAGWLVVSGAVGSWRAVPAAALPPVALSLLCAALGAGLQGRWLSWLAFGCAGVAVMLGGVVVAPGGRVVAERAGLKVG